MTTHGQRDVRPPLTFLALECQRPSTIVPNYTADWQRHVTIVSCPEPNPWPLEHTVPTTKWTIHGWTAPLSVFQILIKLWKRTTNTSWIRQFSGLPKPRQRSFEIHR